MINLGLFYQSGYRIEACYFALNQFRKFYPTAPVALYEDNTNILKPVANKFSCSYSKTNKQGYNDPNSGRPAFDTETILAWLDRVYEACTTTLSEVDWVMNMEDDVWFLGKIDETPNYDLTGIGGRGWQGDELYKFLDIDLRGAYGCGGSIFNRKKFIEAYHASKEVDWNYIERIAGDGSPTQWTDSMLTFIFHYSKFTVGDQRSINCQFGSEIGLENMTNETIEKAELDHHFTKVVHCWKPYYHPTPNIRKEVQEKLTPYH